MLRIMWILSGQKIEFRLMKLFIDTSPFIYFIESHPHFADQVSELILDGTSKNNEFVTSVVTLMEFGVMPERMNRQDLIMKFTRLLEDLQIPLVEINKSIAQRASKLRANYGFLKPMNAIQLAVALELGCSQFITNDRSLSKVSEIEIILLDRILDGE